MSKENILTLENVHKEYMQGKTCIEVLKNVNLAVNAGEMVAIVGNSGCGKSTLLHIAGLLDAPKEGKVKICNIDCSDKDVKKNTLRLNNIGFVYQYHHLLKDFSARENVAMPKIISGASYASSLKEADVLLIKLGLENRLYNLPGELSGGEQQRVAIARCLINSPKIILADEPTGNLDPVTSEEVFKLFVEHASSNGAAIIMVTHNHALANRMHKAYELKFGLLQPIILDNLTKI